MPVSPWNSPAANTASRSKTTGSAFTLSASGWTAHSSIRTCATTSASTSCASARSTWTAGSRFPICRMAARASAWCSRRNAEQRHELPSRGPGQSRGCEQGECRGLPTAPLVCSRLPVGGSGMKTVRVMLVDDHTLFRTGLAELLHGRNDIEVVAATAGATEAARLVEETKPDVLLLDLNLPPQRGR